MKNLLAIALCFSCLGIHAQRQTFTDPDLTFGFTKPPTWKVKDDLVVKVIPKDETFENAITFFSITYFEEPEGDEATQALFSKAVMSPSIPAGLNGYELGKSGKTTIADKEALWSSFTHIQNGEKAKVISYVFKKYNQRFEILISAPLKSFAEDSALLNDLVSSIFVEE